METLSDQAIDAGAAALPEWTLAPDRQSITRELRFADFSTAFAFMTAVALDAQAADHHPDWSNSWATVKIALSSHAAGGLTRLDLDLAARINHHAAAMLPAGD